MKQIIPAQQINPDSGIPVESIINTLHQSIPLLPAKTLAHVAEQIELHRQNPKVEMSIEITGPDMAL